MRVEQPIKKVVTELAWVFLSSQKYDEYLSRKAKK